MSPPAHSRSVSAKGASRALLLALVCTSVSAGSALAQSVAGSVRDASTSAPLPGVLISLLDSDGERVRAVLTDDVGRFEFEVGRFGLYRIRAERIGLQTTTTEAFQLFTLNTREEDLLMGDRAVEIAGLVVDARVQQCRNDPAGAVQIQRWWLEVRTALEVSSVVQGDGLAQFQVERFEREWGPELKRIVATDSRTEMSLSNHPVVSAEADFLAEGGFVQGELMGQREYYAPDADVLLSDTFLSGHCFSITDNDDDKLVGLSFEPTERDVPDIAGTLWVDSTTAELRDLEFKYANMTELPENESGGYVSFEYLPSGAWVVRDWFIRMPKLGLRSGGDDGRRLVVLGYVDVGGQVTLLETAVVDMERLGAVGSIRGVVYDSIHGGGLAGATVSILGTRYQAWTDRDGTFVIMNVPVGEHHLAFFHDDPTAWGLGSPFVTVEVEEDLTSVAYLALPDFRQVARTVCMGSGQEADAVLLGHLVGADDQDLGNVRMELTWREKRMSGQEYDMKHEIRTGSDGRFVVCTLPGEVPVAVSAQYDQFWFEGFEVTLPIHDIVYRRMRIPVGG